MKLHIGRGLSAAALIILAGGLLFAGCSSKAMSSGGAYPQAPAPAASEAAGMPAPQAPLPQGPSDDAGRMIARTASVTIVVDDVKAATQSLENLAATLNGWVTTESMSLPQNDPTSQAYASIVIAVPAESFNDALGKIDAIGKVTDRSIQAEDVTEQVVDIDSRIKTMRASIARLQELMAQSGSVSDIAAVERELTQREADLESLLAQQKSLQQRVSTSTIAINVMTPTVEQQQQKTGFVSALKAGWDAMTTAGRYLIIVIGALLPWAALAAIITVPILVIRKRRRAAGLIPEKKAPVKPIQLVQMMPAAAPMPQQGAPLVQPLAAPSHPAEGRTSPVVVQPVAPVGQPAPVAQPIPVAQPTPVVQPTAAPPPDSPPVKPEPKKK